jgi:predicted metalloendopeptidase
LIGANRPDQRLNYSLVPLSSSDHIGNVIALREFNWNDTKSRLYKPVDRTLCQATLVHNSQLESTAFMASADRLREH